MLGGGLPSVQPWCVYWRLAAGSVGSAFGGVLSVSCLGASFHVGSCVIGGCLLVLGGWCAPRAGLVDCKAEYFPLVVDLGLDFMWVMRHCWIIWVPG